MSLSSVSTSQSRRKRISVEAELYDDFTEDQLIFMKKCRNADEESGTLNCSVWGDGEDDTDSGVSSCNYQFQQKYPVYQDLCNDAFLIDVRKSDEIGSNYYNSSNSSLCQDSLPEVASSKMTSDYDSDHVTDATDMSPIKKERVSSESYEENEIDNLSLSLPKKIIVPEPWIRDPYSIDFNDSTDESDWWQSPLDYTYSSQFSPFQTGYRQAFTDKISTIGIMGTRLISQFFRDHTNDSA